MKRSILILSLLTCMSGVVFAATDVNSSEATKSCCKKQVCSATPISCAKTIDQSGPYCLTRDIVGTIVIAASDVSLDLNSHQIDAGGNPVAIDIQGGNNVKVFNGSVSNSSEIGILINPSSSVELSNLVMNDHTFAAILGYDSNDLRVQDVDFQGSNREVAVLFDTCNNVTIERCNASGFVSTVAAVIELDSCNNVTMQDVKVSCNLKSIAFPAGSFGILTRFVSADTCTGVDLVRVKVNNNIIASEPSLPTIRFSAIGFAFSNSCTLHQCEASNNTNVTGGVSSALDRGLFIGNCDSFIVTEFLANNNRCEQQIGDFRGISPLDSSNLVFDGCQTNNNSVAKLTINPVQAGVIGLFIQSGATGATSVFPSQDCVIRNHQSNFNSCDNGGDRLPTDAIGKVVGIEISNTLNSIALDNCQANHNSMNTQNERHRVRGIELQGVTNLSISNSTADYNTGGLFATGIRATLQGSSIVQNVTIDNCSASSNDGDGLTFDCPALNVEISNSVFNSNGRVDNPEGLFIIGIGIFSGVDFWIKNCIVNNTFFAGTKCYGIFARNSFDIIIEDSSIIGTNAPFTVPVIQLFDVASITGDGPFLVTFNITPQTATPAVGISYDVFGNDNEAYTGTFVATAATQTTLTLSYPTNPGIFGAGRTGASFVPTGVANGIHFEDTSVSQIIRSQIGVNNTNGVMLLNASANSVLDCNSYLNNKSGFAVTGDSNSNLFQGNTAQGNTEAGFEYASTSTVFTAVYQNNFAQGNGPNNNYEMNGNVIQIHTYDIPTAQYTLVPNGASNFPDYTNIEAVIPLPF